MPFRALCLLVLLPFVQAAGAVELANGSWRLPLAPKNPNKALHVSAQGLDPTKPVWVKFELQGISASDKPTGDLVLDAMPLEQRVPLGQSVVRFEAAKLTQGRPDAAVLQQMQAAFADGTAQERETWLGADMARALEAVLNGRGAMMVGSVVRQYDAPGKSDLTFSTSIERTQDIQPLNLKVTLGQGDVPMTEAERDRSYKKDKAWASVFGLLFVLGFWWWRRQRNG